ncbi:MAG: glycosyltransferase family 4 protein [Candidatus Omnitrophota bacterium]|jgi:glycosyltransferase involved in cell wall biosynthesis
MKTLFISYNGAMEPLMLSQGIPYLKGLSRKGVSVYLLSFEKKEFWKKYPKEKIASYREELKSNGIKWYSLRYHKNPSLPATLFDIFMGILLGCYITISKKIDIIHARTTVSAAMGRMITKLTGKKFIFDERGLTAEEYVDGGMWKKDSISYKLTAYFEKIFLIKADGLIVLSENIKDFLSHSDYLPRNNMNKKQSVMVIPCCVDVERFNGDKNITKKVKQEHGLAEKFVFLYAGSLGTWYLLSEMIDFFITAKERIKNAHFLIVTHTGKKIADKYCREKGLHESDFTIIESEFEDVPYYTKLGDAGMFFIKQVLSKRSSCPTKFAEYLASSLPVIINSQIGDTDVIVENNRLGVVIKDLNKDAYMNALNELMELLKDKDMLVARCHKTVDTMFSLEMGVSKYFSIYNKVLYGREA